MGTKVETSQKLDPFVQEHERLHQTLHELRQLLEERSPREDVQQALTEFDVHVKNHFVHEEEEKGFFDSVVEQAPRLKPRADHLLEEHSLMASELNELIQHVAVGDMSDEWWSLLQDNFESFWQLFCRHERCENDLLQEAFHDDIGAED